MSTQNTHLGIDPEWVGTATELDEGHAVVQLATRPEMAADDRGLVHGGFIFGVADYAAMLAVNDPCVVLGAAEVRFVQPVMVDEVVEAIAELREVDGQKNFVEVTCQRGPDDVVFEGTFTCFVLEQHVLDGKA